jgi:hypothetical protein
MKKAFIVICCLLLLAPLPSCRKKSKSDKQFEKTTKARMAGEAERERIQRSTMENRMALPH